MYIPRSFVVEDQAIIDQFITDNAFGQLISMHDGQLCSSHLPFLYDAERSLMIGHLGRQNPQHKDLGGQQVMVTLAGAHGYISPTWYAVNSVPTWNYQAVNIYGQCQIFNDPERLAQVVDSLAHQYEQHQDQPWIPEYRVEMLQAIVGFELKIAEIQCKFKLNQNRSAADMQGVIDHLDPVKQADLLAAMQQALVHKQQNS